MARAGKEARAFQSRAQQVLAHQMTFTEWLLLETIEELSGEMPDAVKQNAIAARSGLSRSVVSYWLEIMAECGMVDRGEHFNPRAWSVIVTEPCRVTLRDCNRRLQSAGLFRSADG